MSLNWCTDLTRRPIIGNRIHLQNRMAILIEKKTKKKEPKCYVCYKKLKNRVYIIMSKHETEREVCSNCAYIYKFMKRQMVDNKGRNTISGIYGIIMSMKEEMSL